MNARDPGPQVDAPTPIDELSFVSRVPFARLLGLHLHKFENGESEMHFAPKPEHLNTFDVTHGGACMTLLDVTMATAARSVAQEMGVVTIEMKTSFMRPAVGPLVARGKLMHRTASMAFTEATIYDPSGRACAHATGTFKYVKRRLPPADGRDTGDRPPSTD